MQPIVSSLFVMSFLASALLAAEPPTNVRAEICEQELADKDVWPETSPASAEDFTRSAFALDELPVLPTICFLSGGAEFYA